MRISDWSSDVCSSDLKTAKVAAREAKKLKAPRNQRVFFLKVMCIISRGTAKGHDAGIHNSGQ